MFSKTPRFLPFCFALVATSASAAETAHTLNELVVTASGSEQALTQAPASISVINRSDIKNRAYRDITDVIEDVPGVIATGGGSRTDISIRGLPAEYTLLMVDGRKVSGRESQPNGSSGLEQGWLPPLEAIERIEIIRGPMSTLYGSDAVGGVINIITKKTGQSWQGNLRADRTFQDNPDSGDYYQTQFNVSGPLIDELLSVRLSGSYFDREEDDILRGYSGNELANHQAALSLTPTRSDTVTLTHSGYNQDRTFTSGRSLPLRNNSGETRNTRRAVSLAHSGDYNTLGTDSFVQNEWIENQGRDITIENRTARNQWSLPLGLHSLTLGAGYEDNQLDDETTNAGSVSEISNSQWSVFAEDEWFIGDRFTLTLGARLDDNERYNTHVSPRIYGVWAIDDTWTLKSGVSTGYRAPDLRELSPEWVQESRGGDIYGNPDLEPETSVNTELGIYFQPGKRFQANVTGFHNKFEDKLMVVDCPASRCNASNARYNINIDTAETRGVELAASLALLDDLDLQTSYTYTRSEQTSGDNEGQPLTQIPEHLLNLNARWQIHSALQSWVKLSYRGEESEPASLQSRNTVRAPSNMVTDFGGSWQATPNVRVMAGIYNVFDESFTYDEYGYVDDGRRYWLAADISFGTF
jgi:outer membrane receptor for ferrienterochelin and colicins